MVLAERIFALFLLVQLTQALWIQPTGARYAVRRTNAMPASFAGRVMRNSVAFRMVADEVEDSSVESTEEVESADDEEASEEGASEDEEKEEVAHDPHAEAIKALEKELQSELTSLEAVLKAERLSLSRTRDRVSESGKNGFFIVQAQVADFQRKRDADQKARVERNKKEFIEKMIPVVDAFREAPVSSPASTEKEENMHKNFGSLLQGILTVFGKYGFEEFNAGTVNEFSCSSLDRFLTYSLLTANDAPSSMGTNR
jgi:molecular chaperone GrpE (heat shock protein)